MPSPYPTEETQILTVDSTPAPQPDLQAAQENESSSPTMVIQEPEPAQIETSSPTTSDVEIEIVPIEMVAPIETSSPTTSVGPTSDPTHHWNGGGWTSPNPTLIPVCYPLCIFHVSKMVLVHQFGTYHFFVTTPFFFQQSHSPTRSPSRMPSKSPVWSDSWESSVSYQTKSYSALSIYQF